MLDDGDRWFGKVEGSTKGGIGIDVVVVTHLFAVELGRRGNTRLLRVGFVHRCTLVGIFSVPQHVPPRPRCTPPAREIRVLADNLRRHPGGNGDVVGGGVRERFRRQLRSLGQRETSRGDGPLKVLVPRR